MIQAVSFISIPVSNQDKALDFYTKKLGFTLKQDSPLMENERWIELEIPGRTTRVVLSGMGKSRMGSFMNMSFTTENLDETCQDLKNKGVEFTQEPTQENWGAYALFKDLDNNIFCLSESH